MPHDVKIPDYVIERIRAKRGRLNVFDRFDPARTALVVIDMQNFFVAEVETARSICPGINRLAAALRARGGVVARVLPTVADAACHDEDDFAALAGVWRSFGGLRTAESCIGELLAPEAEPAAAG